MLGFLQQIMDGFKVAISLIQSLFSGLADIILVLPSFVTYTQGLFAWLPSPFSTFCLLGISLTLLFVIIGRI